VTAGCDSDAPLRLPGLPEPAEEPDHDRVLAALQDERAALARVRQVQRQHRSNPQLRAALAEAASVHETHVGLLVGAVDDEELAPGEGSRRELSPGGAVPRDPAGAAAEVVRLERTLADRHVETAMRSESGVLARVVASMSAAAAQRAAVLAPLAVKQRTGETGEDAS